VLTSNLDPQEPIAEVAAVLIRRIYESVRVKNYSQLALELFVVIVGVFIGIQAANWNDERIDRLRTQSYLAGLRADLDTDLLNYQISLEFWSEVSEYGRQALRYSETGDLEGLNEWDLLLAYFQASQVQQLTPTQATYDELRSGGELRLIGELTFRNLLAGYYTRARNPILTESPAYREHVRGLIPIHVQEYIWDSCFESGGGVQQLLDCASPIELSEAKRLITSLSEDEELMSELRYWMSTMRVAREIVLNQTKSAHDLRNFVDGMVSRTSTLRGP
jgi:hypothetical protein